MERNKITIYLLIMLSIGLGFDWFMDNKIFCRDEYNILISQYLDNTSSLNGGVCNNNCLFMQVLKIKSGAYYGLNDYSEYANEFKTLYFANENSLRKDLSINSEIIITWCNTNNGERVRGIK